MNVISSSKYFQYISGPLHAHIKIVACTSRKRASNINMIDYIKEQLQNSETLRQTIIVTNSPTSIYQLVHLFRLSTGPNTQNTNS